MFYYINKSPRDKILNVRMGENCEIPAQTCVPDFLSFGDLVAPTLCCPGSVRVVENFSEISPRLLFFLLGMGVVSASESNLSSSSVNTF